MSTVFDVFRFVIIDNRDLYPQENEAGKIDWPSSSRPKDLYTRLWRSTRGLMEQLQKETNSKTEEAVADHMDHILSKRAEMIFSMVKDHTRIVRIVRG